ncbi:hypothetical protein PV762_16805 [Mitsuaria sp. CC2]|uniref:hypothetical protein n=1 Tax=Mitsuaria sp. CC2 TaxID=3029186 RepID=UPI003B8DDDD8
MLQATDENRNATEGEDLFSGAYVVRIAALSPQRIITATVTPLNLGTNEADLEAVVSWEGIDTVSTSVRTALEPGAAYFDPWVRFLHLLSVVLGPKTVPEAKDFGAGKWSSIVLSSQELDGALQHSVVVAVDRELATASLVRSDRARQGAEAAVPRELLQRDAGTVLTEMTSRLIRGRPWQ